MNMDNLKKFAINVSLAKRSKRKKRKKEKIRKRTSGNDTSMAR